jgi:hypothetical protein
MENLTLETLEKDKIELVAQQQQVIGQLNQLNDQKVEAIAQVNMINGAMQFVEQKIDAIKNPKNENKK